MKIVTVVGARPQFIKAAAISRAIAARSNAGIAEVLVHTGQHYDEKMSGVFFEELGIHPPAYNLGVSGGGHGAMTGRMLEALEPVLIKEQPDWVLIYGDTNSTLAAALAASKLHIPIAHVEAGLRSFNMKMPEEINRIVADRLSSLLLCPTKTSIQNLKNEGILTGVHLVGDVMYDVALHFAEIARQRSTILADMKVLPKNYILATCHRAENTDDKARLSGIVTALSTIAKSTPVVFPIHPRTKAKIGEYGLLGELKNIMVIDPVSYLDMVALEKDAKVIVTDSGGVQKEAYFYHVPCVTTRDETEWVETVASGWNSLVGADAQKIIDAVAKCGTSLAQSAEDFYGSGHAADLILDTIVGAQVKP